VERIPKHDVLLLLGNFNARVGSNNDNRGNTLGRHGVGVINDNGEILCDFSESNGLTVGGTLFQHKDIPKLTWKSPDGTTRSEIDHIIMNRRWRRSLNDVWVRRSADIGSDHHLLVAKLRLKLRKVRHGACRKEAL